jgi:hypothetical protein
LESKLNLINISELNIEVDAGSKPMWSIVVGDYRYVLFSTNKALIFKGDNQEPSYEVTPVGCTCPGDRYSSNACKHRKAISFIGDGSAEPPVEDTSVRANQPDISFDGLFE